MDPLCNRLRRQLADTVTVPTPEACWVFLSWQMPILSQRSAARFSLSGNIQHFRGKKQKPKQEKQKREPTIQFCFGFFLFFLKRNLFLPVVTRGKYSAGTRPILRRVGTVLHENDHGFFFNRQVVDVGPAS